MCTYCIIYTMYGLVQFWFVSYLSLSLSGTWSQYPISITDSSPVNSIAMWMGPYSCPLKWHCHLMMRFVHVQYIIYPVKFTVDLYITCLSKLIHLLLSVSHIIMIINPIILNNARAESIFLNLFFAFVFRGMTSVSSVVITWPHLIPCSKVK